MNESELNLPTYYIYQIGEQLSARGIDVEQWLAKSGLTKSKINRPEQSISFLQFKRLIASALRLSNDPTLGLQVGKQLGLTTHGMLGFAIIASGNLQETVELFSRFLNTRTPLLRVELVYHESELEVQLHECYPLEDIKIPFFESAIFTLYNLIMQVTQNSAPITKIGLPFSAPKYQILYAEMFEFEIVFDSPCASVGLLRRNLLQPLQMADPNSLRQAKELCELELQKLQAEELFQNRIRKYLLSMKNGFPTLTDTSTFFHTSPRSLHRRLEKEDTSYSQVLKSVRVFRATELLREHSMTIQGIAFTLGYSDVANFRKAFKQWKGVSPQEFRKMSEIQLE